MPIACLLLNTVAAACKQNGVEVPAGSRLSVAGNVNSTANVVRAGRDSIKEPLIHSVILP